MGVKQNMEFISLFNLTQKNNNYKILKVNHLKKKVVQM